MFLIVKNKKEIFISEVLYPAAASAAAVDDVVVVKLDADGIKVLADVDIDLSEAWEDVPVIEEAEAKRLDPIKTRDDRERLTRTRESYPTNRVKRVQKTIENRPPLKRSMGKVTDRISHREEEPASSMDDGVVQSRRDNSDGVDRLRLAQEAAASAASLVETPSKKSEEEEA